MARTAQIQTPDAEAVRRSDDGSGAYGIDMAVVTGSQRMSPMPSMPALKWLSSSAVAIFSAGCRAAAKGMDRATGDYMGMLATVMNALAFQNALENQNTPSRVLSAIPMQTVCEPFTRPRAMHHLDKGRVVIFAAGTGNPFFTTDTAATLRAIEMECDAVAKATQVDGVYSADPKKDPKATRYETVTHSEVLAKDLKVMDGAAIALGARQQAAGHCVFHRRAWQPFESAAWHGAGDDRYGVSHQSKSTIVVESRRTGPLLCSENLHDCRLPAARFTTAAYNRTRIHGRHPCPTSIHTTSPKLSAGCAAHSTH